MEISRNRCENCQPEASQNSSLGTRRTQNEILHTQNELVHTAVHRYILLDKLYMIFQSAL